MVESFPTAQRFLNRYFNSIIFKEKNNIYQVLLPRHLLIEEILFEICISGYTIVTVFNPQIFALKNLMSLKIFNKINNMTNGEFT